jgi:hypothetical protein
MVDTDLWNNEDIIANFTAEDKYFWLYLLTNPHNKMCGVLKNSPSLIARDMGLHKDTIVNLIYRFERNHELIYCDKDTNEIFILNWYKYNWTKSPKIVEIIKKEQNEVKSLYICNLINDRISVVLGEKEDTLSIGYRYPTNTITNTDDSCNDIFQDYNLSDKVKDSIIKWLTYKKEKKQTYKDTGLKTLLNKLVEQIKAKGEQNVIDSIEYSISNNWSGIYSPNSKTSKPKEVETPKYSNTNADDALERALERSNEKSIYSV